MKFDFNPITGKLDLNGGGGADTAVYYTSDEPTTEAHGGIPAGATFDHEPVCKVIDRILHKAQPPAVTLTPATFKAGLYETGQKLSDTLRAAIRPGTGKVVKIDFYAGGALSRTDENPGGDATYATDTAADRKYKVVVTDENGLTAASDEVAYTFRRPVYYGLTSGVPTGIDGLTKKLSAGGSGITVPYPTFDTRRLVFATTGTMTKAINPSGFDITASFSKTTVVVDCLDGAKVKYNVYYSNVNSQLEAYPVKFSFSTR